MKTLALVIVGLVLSGCSGHYATFVRCPAPLDTPAIVTDTISKQGNGLEKLWLQGHELQQDILRDCFTATLVNG